MFISNNNVHNNDKYIDVSEYQYPIDLAAVKAAGFDGIIFRLFKKGRIDDKTFETYARPAMEMGFTVKGYWYVYASGMADFAQECAAAFERAAEVGIKQIFVDIEGEAARLPKDLLKEFVGYATVVGNQYGIKAGVYCNYSFYNKNKEWIDVYDFWLARYNSYLGEVGEKIIGWQYTSKGNIPGINGYVDVNYWWESKNTEETGKRVLRYTRTIMSGDDVADYQHQLNEEINANLVEDGKFGPSTENATKAYQMLRKLKVDGKAGNEVFGALEKEKK